MIQGILGKKIGMTHLFDKDGNIIPVTIVEAGPCTVLSLMDMPNNGKRVKVGFGMVKERRLRRSELGYFQKLGVTPLKIIRDIESTDNSNYKVGQEIKADVFRPGDFVNVSGLSKGKGFQGGMKRWNWSGGPAGHGSMHHRRVGSIGASSDPSRTYRGAHMPGHMGMNRVSVQGLRIMDVDTDNNLLLIKGAIPGHKKAIVMIERSKKKAYRSLEEKKAAVIKSRNPLKHSKAKAKGKA